MNTTSEENGFGTPENIEDCRAANLGEGSFGECLRGGPNQCKYALPFGYCFLCQHPRLEEIIRHTGKLQGAVTASIEK